MTQRKGLRWNLHSAAWALGVAGLSAVYLLGVSRPQLQRLNALGEDVAETRSELASRTKWLETLARASREADALGARVANLDQRIPAQPLLGGFLEDLARVAQKRSLHSDTIQPGEPVRVDDVVALPIVIRVRGPFSAVHGFIQEIERMPRLTRFDQFKVSVDEQHAGAVRAELNLKVFYGTAPPGVRAG